ncbi:transglycosylase SLT domain-containing protein [Aquabacterium sp.]|uniref:transglycosylase SLT domain-containing protein n=1 Tax=Aquabacterium sp. TaxID=1872578 RepID=UPI0040380CB0
MRITYKYASWGASALSALTLVAGMVVAPASRAAADDSTVQEAREALRVRDKARLLAARDALIAGQHPLAPWADYWYFQVRLMEAGPTEVDAFLARWPDSYVADRARNDWLLELGHRRDWRTFLRIQPTFRMNDDREVSCLGVLARQQTNTPMEAPGDWREQARQFWWNQKDADFGCDAMAQALLSSRVLEPADVWRKLRLAIEADKPRAVQQSAKLLGDAVSQAVAKLMGQPQMLLMPQGRAAAPGGADDDRHHAPGSSIGPDARGKSKGKPKRKAKGKVKPDLTPMPLALPNEAEGPLTLLAFIRWAGMDPVGAAAAIEEPANRSRWRWGAEETAWAWAQLGRSAAWRLSPQAPVYFERALTDRALAAGTGELRQGGSRLATAWSSETLAWMARAGLRSASAGQAERWALVEQAVDAMAPDQQQDAAWVYWKAKALQGRARGAGGPAGDALKQQARELLTRVASPVTFYGQLAAQDLHGTSARAPVKPTALTEAELAEARAMPGIDRALRMLELGWRGEALREWNFTLSYGKVGGLSDRELLAVSEEACRREIWDRCINSSERTRQELNLEQRYPMPFKQDVLSAAREVGLDPAYMYGLIRQESRFQQAAKSSVGASGLMQVMPATAAWTARKLSIDYHPDNITDRSTNLRIGAGYLKLVLDDFQGAQALAAAAYNAGPSRPRRWRDGPRIDAAAWVENIPFNETRDYVKKVLSNTTVYAHLIHGKALSVRSRLGATVGPRADTAPPSEDDLP